MPIYNKLVRDRIPEIIKGSGKNYLARTLKQEEFIVELKNKLFEEVEEYIKAENNKDAVEELADVLEIIYSLSEVHGETPMKVEEIRQLKAGKRGGFKEKVYLIDVDD